MILIVLAPIIICLIISYLATSILYKVAFLALGGFLTITIGLNYINNLINDTLKKSKELKNVKGECNFKSKVVENEDYINLATVLKEFMKDKALSREQILDFKDNVNIHLGESKNHYTFKFKNDLHEIYCKIKNKSLTSKDYQELLKILNNYNEIN